MKNDFLPWISVSFEGWASRFVVVRSYLGETRRYMCWRSGKRELKEAEAKYRAEFGLIGKHLQRINA